MSFIQSALLQLMMRAAENAFQFAGTMTGPGGLGSVGSTATYEFEGTSISVFGLTRADSTKTNMTLEFAIDGSFQKSATIQPHQFETFHLKFFESPTLADGHHTLEITISSINSTDVLLDYLIYEASQNATLEGSAQILVLNTSPQLTYSQGWSTGITGLRGGLIEQAISLNNSVEGAADLGATVALNFTGSGFEVRGMLVKEFPSAAAAYSLDGGPWLDVQMPMNGSSYFNAQSNFEFIGQRFNSMETHSLVITPLIPGAFFLDFITVQSSTAFFPRKANVAPPASLTTSTSASPTFTQPLSPTASGSEMPTPHGLHAGAIAGICIAIAACIGLAALGDIAVDLELQVAPRLPLTQGAGLRLKSRQAIRHIVTDSRSWSKFEDEPPASPTVAPPSSTSTAHFKLLPFHTLAWGKTVNARAARL
ncbi:hypothetical protein B0H17DRAFT_1198916 [Mycena rosella]|uniref:Uncharacterized protein n=1 Tax=Mycena rosella TaxID=1033263 RepID=A0AAD7GMI1_MYCRO|nr:hypothetical protein B0H17DRAFT_1198916 [Mycena rosella]